MDDALLLSIFTGVEGAHAFSAFMPSWFTVQKFATESGDLERLRSGYVPAIIFNLTLGATVATISKKALPLLISLLVIVFMIAAYEGAIQQKAV